MMRGLVLGLAVLSACAPETPAPAPTPAESQTTNPAPGLEASPAPAPSDADPASAQAAVDVVLAYYGAIAEGAYLRAYEMWGPDGPPGESLADFERGFADTAQVQATVDAPSDAEGAAGSVYVTVPVHVTAQTTSGQEQRFEGEYTLRRVNDVAGAEPWQLRWHIAGADLREVE